MLRCASTRAADGAAPGLRLVATSSAGTAAPEVGEGLVTLALTAGRTGR